MVDKLIALGFKPHAEYGTDRMTLKMSNRFSLVYDGSPNGFETLILLDCEKAVAVPLYIDGCLFDTIDRAISMFGE